MTDLELLFLVLGIVYIWECACWLKRGAVGFRTWLGSRWKVMHPGRLLGNQKGGMILAHPLPPLGTLLTSNPWPLSLSPEAVLAYVPGTDPASRVSQPAGFVLFDQIQSVQASGKNVRVNGQALLQAASLTLASHIAHALQTLRQTAARQRARAIEKLIEDTFDTQAVRERWEQFRTETASLRFAANVLFAYLFLAAPALIWHAGLSFAWKWLLIALLVYFEHRFPFPPSS